MMKNVLVTGANGFIGRALCKKMQAAGRHVRGAVRTAGHADALPSGIEAVAVGSIGPRTDWSDALETIDTIVHLAAKVHVQPGRGKVRVSDYRDVNVAGTERLARTAVKRNIKRFVFISSIKVNGEGQTAAYTEKDRPSPKDPYSISKWEAEQVLNDIGSHTDMEVVILRSPLVYGPGVKANFLRLLKWVHSGLPLPFANIKNRRSLIYLENFVDAIFRCADHQKSVAGQTYLVSDKETVSTADLIRRVASALDKPSRLWPLPISLMRYGAKFTGKTAAADRLLGSLFVDMTKIRTELDWAPPYAMEQGLEETARWYKQAMRFSN